MRVVEHHQADTDNGWTGNSADTGVSEGAGYVADLYDCDGSGLCNVGPSCSLAPHSSCGVLLAAASGVTGDQICAVFGQGTCRKTRTAHRTTLLPGRSRRSATRTIPPTRSATTSATSAP